MSHSTMLMWQRCSFRKVAYSILSLYLAITCYTGFHLLTRKLQSQTRDRELLNRIKSLSEIDDDPDWNPWGEEFESEQRPVRHHAPPSMWQVAPPTIKPHPSVSSDVNSSLGLVVEVWGKAAIGLYLWEHVVGGVLEERMDGLWSYGEATVDPVTFRFRTGPGVVPGKVPRHTEHLLLVLNGRESSKVKVSKMWLDFLPTLPQLKGVGVVLLGNESCDNSWLHPYMSRHGGLVQFAFLVYDSPEVDNIHFYQWPLGVATYRDFPLIDSSDLPLQHPRPYMYNFLGTVYPHSSRETLLAVLNSSSYQNQGLIKARRKWLPQETEETMRVFTQALSSSDLTLNPVGMNTECYRVYEAMAMGSVPVVEDVMTPGLCGAELSNLSATQRRLLLQGETDGRLKSHKNSAKRKKQDPAPLRLLKEFKAPIIYVKNWQTDLLQVLQKETEMSDVDRVKRREKVVQWYDNFRIAMRDKLVRVIVEKFYHKVKR